jgi:hypothetical protein
MDGRYEETFPEETFELNERFYNKEGTNWAALVHGHDVNFIIVDRRRTNLADIDLVDLGYERVWGSPLSDLWAKNADAAALKNAASTLPDYTIQPLDAKIVNQWPCFSRPKH